MSSLGKVEQRKIRLLEDNVLFESLRKSWLAYHSMPKEELVAYLERQKPLDREIIECLLEITSEAQLERIAVDFGTWQRRNRS